MRAPLFEVTAAAADAAARRLTTKEKVKAALRITATTDDTLIESKIDQVSALAATYCKLARPLGATPPTLGAETLRATWFAEPDRCTGTLVLPWRAPLRAITSIVENDVALIEGTDFELLNGGLLLRLSSVTGRGKLWSGHKIVAVYTAGLSLPDSVPADLEGQVIEQVKLFYMGTARDPSVRQLTVPDVIGTTFSVAGGDSISESGLLCPLESALSPYKDWSQG